MLTGAGETTYLPLPVTTESGGVMRERRVWRGHRDGANFPRRLLVGTAALALSMGLLSTIGMPSAWANKDTATGAVWCNTSYQVLTWSNVLQAYYERVVVDDCYTPAWATGNADLQNVTAKGKGQISGLSCSTLTVATGTVTAVTASATVKWPTKIGKEHIDPSVLTLSQVAVMSAGNNGDVALAYGTDPYTGVSTGAAPGTVTGSFAGPSSGELDTNLTAAQLAKDCGSKSVLKKLKIDIASIYFGASGPPGEG